MPEQPYVITAKRFEEFKRQMQQLLDDLYNERVAGALIGDVFEIDNQSDILKLNLYGAGGLTKYGSTLGIKPDPVGPITLSTNGIDVALATTVKKGVIKALSGSAGQFLNGQGDWATPDTSYWPIGAVFTAAVDTDPVTLLGYGIW